MKLIVGLGNPEKKYFDNRHNVGYLAIDYLQEKLHSSDFISSRDFIVKKSDQFMNSSGIAIKKIVENLTTKLVTQLKIENLYVVHDDLDIPLGEYKIQFAKGPKLHNGIESVEAKLGTKDFWRIRIGVDNRDSDNRTPGEQYVLQDFTTQERQILEEVFLKIEKDLQKIINGQ